MGIIGSFEGYVSSPLYLFNGGTYGGGQSGITKIRDTCTGSTDSWSLSSQIYFMNLFHGYYLLRFNNVIDLSPYRYLKVIGYCEGNWVGIGGGASPDSGMTRPEELAASAESAISSSSSGEQTLICDISRLLENHFIYVWGKHNSGNNTRNCSIVQILLTNN